MSSFFKRLKVGSIWPKNLHARQGSNQQEALYQDLSLPLAVFIRCLVHSDYTGLVLRGKPTENEITLAWASIYSQYVDLNAENEEQYILKLQRDITLLASHVSETETCLYFLQDIYHVGLLDVLEANGYKRIKADFHDTEQWGQELQVIQNKLARKKLDLETKKKEYESHIAARIGHEVTEKYFTTILLRLAKYQGVAIISTRNISVYEFVTLLQDYLTQTTKADGEEG